MEQNGLDGAHGDLRVVDESERRVHRLNGGIMPELAAVSLLQAMPEGNTPSFFVQAVVFTPVPLVLLPDSVNASEYAA